MYSSTLSTGESTPGSQVPDNAERGSDADWKTWIRSSFDSVAHPIGTAAMMRRSLGGSSKKKKNTQITTRNFFFP